MFFRRPNRDELIQHAPPSGPTGAEGQQLTAVHAQAQRLHTAGDDTIDRALSGDAEQFLQDSAQTGGE